MSAGKAAAVNGVWPRGKACRAEHSVMPKKAKHPHPHPSPHPARWGPVMP